MSQPSTDARAVVRAFDALTTRVRRIADSLSPTARPTDDAPTTTADDGVAYRIEQERNAAHLYRKGLISDRELNAVFAATDDVLAARTIAHHVPAEAYQAWTDQPPADGPCAQHPHAPTFDGKCGGCTQYPADMRQAPAADEDAQRADRRASLRNLLDRAGRGVLIGGTEGELLRQQVEAELRHADQLRAGRDTWRTKAEEIERDRDRLAADLEATQELLGYENKRADDAIDREETAEQAAEEQRRRADIFETELRVLRAGLRANGADPTQIQNLWAQIRLRNRQWRDTKRDLAEAQSVIERVREVARWLRRNYPALTHVRGRLADALDGTEQPTTEEQA